MAPRDIPAGSDYGDQIEAAIMKAEAVVLIYNEAALQSKWVKGEINTAFEEDTPIFPFKTQDVPLHGSLRVMLNQFHWIDAVGNTQRGAEELLKEIKKICADPMETRILAEIGLLLQDWKELHAHSEQLYQQILKKEGLLKTQNHAASKEIDALKNNRAEDEIKSLQGDLARSRKDFQTLSSRYESLSSEKKKIEEELLTLKAKEQAVVETILKYVPLRDVVELVIISAKRSCMTATNTYSYADIDEEKLKLLVREKYGLTFTSSLANSLTIAEAGFILWKDINRFTKGTNSEQYNLTEKIVDYVMREHKAKLLSLSGSELSRFIYQQYHIRVGISYDGAGIVHMIESAVNSIIKEMNK